MVTDAKGDFSSDATGRVVSGQKKHRMRPGAKIGNKESRSLITIVCLPDLVSCVHAMADYFDGQVISTTSCE